MSWLDERIIQYLYKKDDEQMIIEAKASEEVPEAPSGWTYVGFVPDKLFLMTKVQFVQNGRIGYRIDVGNGQQIYRSATRERYEHVVGNTGAEQSKEMKRQGVPIEYNKTVFEKKYGEAVAKGKKEKAAAVEKKFKSIIKGDK